MGRREAPHGSRATAAAVCLGLSVVAVGLGAAALDEALRPTATATGATALVAAEAQPVPAVAAGVASTEATPAPVEVRVPSLGVTSPLVRLGTNPDGSLEVPADAAVAGWFTAGPTPGAVGPAVVVGHVDSQLGPGVFADLHAVRVGEEVEVDRDDGSTARFVVTAVQQVAKDAFPTEQVYGPVAGPQLRLITCGGSFDHATGHYDDNVVVYARLV